MYDDMTRKHVVTPQSEKIIKVDQTLSRRFQFVMIICAGPKMLLCTLGVSFDANAMQCSNAPKSLQNAIVKSISFNCPFKNSSLPKKKTSNKSVFLFRGGAFPENSRANKFASQEPVLGPPLNNSLNRAGTVGCGGCDE